MKKSPFEKYEKMVKLVSKNTNTDNEMVLLPLWLRYLDDNLKFPFKCVITDDFKISNELDVNDIVNLKLISEFYEECYWLFWVIYKGRRKYIIPLTNLKCEDKDGDNFDFLEGYCYWYCNR